MEFNCGPWPSGPACDGGAGTVSARPQSEGGCSPLVLGAEGDDLPSAAHQLLEGHLLARTGRGEGGDESALVGRGRPGRCQVG